MTGLGLGLCGGVGLFFVWWACWPTPGDRDARPARRRLRDRWNDDLATVAVPGVVLTHLLLVSAIVAVAVLLLAFGLSGVPAVALCFAGIAGSVPAVVVRSVARRRRAQLRDVWPDVVDNLASAVRAGLSLPEALGQLALRGPEQLRAPFAAFTQDYRATGRFNDALDALKDRLSDSVGDRVVESLRVAREVGGSELGQLLRTLSTFLRQEARTRSELESRQSWTVNGARLAVAAPWVVLALLSTRPESVAAYDGPVGAAVLLTGAGVSVVAYRSMLAIARLPEDERVLR
ncbi:MAG TPA: type II secretion system F family protein [Actinomycetales bacterium]|nr:type II secretion system F family protein [Actinomycetales bacterium]